MIKVGSCECSKAELDLFSMPPTNTSMESGTYEENNPVSPLDSVGDIEFNIESGYQDYIDIGRTYIVVRARVTKGKAEKLKKDAKVAPINNWLHSLFSQVNISMNNKLITPSLNTYPWRAYLENLLSFGSEAKNNQGTSHLWYADTGNMNEDNPVADKPTNLGMAARGQLIGESKSVEMIGRLHSDIFHQNRYLPPGIELCIKLSRSDPCFHLIGAEEGYHTHLEAVSIFVRKVKLNPAISVQHNKLLNSGKMMKYPIRRAEVTSHIINANVFNKTIDQLIVGQLPRRLILGMISNASHSGQITENPFNFQTFGLKYLSLTKDSVAIPSKPLTPNFKEGHFLSSYMSLLEGTGLIHTDRGNGINRSNYAHGFTLFAFDLTPDMAEGGHVDPIKHGKISLSVQFEKALEQTINIIVYAEYDNVIQIDRAKNVTADYM